MYDAPCGVVPIIGVALFTIAVVAGQTGNALVVDRIGLAPAGRAPIHPLRVLAAILSVVGVAVAVSSKIDGSGRIAIPVAATLVVGGLTAVQSATNARMNLVSAHPLATTLINFGWGSVLLVVVGGVRWALGNGPSSLGQVPWWAYGGGALGIVFIAIGAWAVRHIGVLVFAVATLLGNLVGAVVIDLLGGHGFGPSTYLGIALTFVAAALATWAGRPRRGSGQR